MYLGKCNLNEQKFHEGDNTKTQQRITTLNHFYQTHLVLNDVLFLSRSLDVAFDGIPHTKIPN
jgi:hypothetical protein